MGLGWLSRRNRRATADYRLAHSEEWQVTRTTVAKRSNGLNACGAGAWDFLQETSVLSAASMKTKTVATAAFVFITLVLSFCRGHVAPKPGSAEFPAPLPLKESVAGRRCLSNSAVPASRKAAVIEEFGVGHPVLRWFSRARPAFRPLFPGRTLCLRGPTHFADSRTSMPPPDPRSSTVSPGFRLASAVGLPHPHDASNASRGTSVVWLAS